MRLRTAEGHFTLTHVDELVDEMLRNEYLFDIALPRVPIRSVGRICNCKIIGAVCDVAFLAAISH